MGTMQHDAILVTSWDQKRLRKARAEAVSLMRGLAPVSTISRQVVNGYRSFWIGPDGSKEGWKESDDAHDHRAEFLAWIHDQAHEDGSNNLSWAAVSWGELGVSVESELGKSIWTSKP